MVKGGHYVGGETWFNSPNLPGLSLPLPLHITAYWILNLAVQFKALCCHLLKVMFNSECLEEL